MKKRSTQIICGMQSHISIKNKVGNDIREKFKYQRMHYKCKMSDDVDPDTPRIRNTSTYKTKCGSRFSVLFDKKISALRLKESVEKHNHLLSKEFFTTLPKQRRINTEEKESIETPMPFKPNGRDLQNVINEKRSAKVTLRDIQNVKQKLADKNEGNVMEKMVNELINFKKEIIKIYADENKNVLGIYYQDRGHNNGCHVPFK